MSITINAPCAKWRVRNRRLLPRTSASDTWTKGRSSATCASTRNPNSTKPFDLDYSVGYCRSVSKQGLETHLVTHCSQKLLACEECNFRCRSLFGLDRHYQVTHGQVNVPGFYSLLSMFWMKFFVQIERCLQGWSQTYECHCCLEKFARGNQLTKHLIKVHDFHWPSGHSRFR